MLLSKELRMSGFKIVAYAQHFCDKLKDSPDNNDQIVRTRCKNSLKLMAESITAIPKTPMTFDEITNDLLHEIETFRKLSKTELQKHKLSLFFMPSKKQDIEQALKNLNNTYSEIYDSVIWYCKETKLFDYIFDHKH